jgi:hypothetical protein
MLLDIVVTYVDGETECYRKNTLEEGVLGNYFLASPEGESTFINASLVRKVSFTENKT